MDARPTKARTPEAWLATVPDGTRGMCEEVREWIAEWAPDLTESIKWNMLAFSGCATVVMLGGFTKPKLSPSCWREYITWLNGAKRPETQERRLAKTLAALTGGHKWGQRKEG